MKRARWYGYVAAILLSAGLGIVWRTTVVLHRCGMTGREARRILTQTGSLWLFKHYLVEVGTPESRLRARFGAPSLVIRTDGKRWREYNEGRRRAHWSVPTRVPSAKVLIYEPSTEHWLIVAYYYIDTTGTVE